MSKLKWAFSFVMLLLCLSGVSFAAGVEGDLPAGSEVLTFVELGSVKCIPCKKMQPIVDEIKKEYAGKVKVVFHDVWSKEGREAGSAYGVRLIPTQVFLDKSGNEVFRHEGFFGKKAIEKVLSDNGVSL